MAYQITFTKRFEKHFKNLNAQEKKQLQNKLRLLAENPMHPSLRTKHIQGIKDLFECSVNMDLSTSREKKCSNMLSDFSFHHDPLSRLFIIFPCTAALRRLYFN